MSKQADVEQLAADLIAGRLSEHGLCGMGVASVSTLIDCLYAQAAGRRWLRSSQLLTEDLADRLLEQDADFSQQRVDTTLVPVIQVASLDSLVAHAIAIAAGTAAPALWSRLAAHPSSFRMALAAVQSSGSARALEATATHLLLDPAAPYGLAERRRLALATAIVESDAGGARAVAAEFLLNASPATLASRIDQLALDDAASVRGFGWLAAFRTDRAAALERAVNLLGDETLSAEIRRSALNAAGESAPTDQVVGLLSYFVVHPIRELALDAANLLHRHHRHPEIAIAAAGSPHVEVRDIANRLMDPYRGSPAAGGSRPGAQLHTDPLLQLMRQLEEETEE